MKARPINVLVPPHLGCHECRKWCNVWHDFWCQVAIAGLMEIIQVNEQSLGFRTTRAGVDEYRLV